MGTTAAAGTAAATATPASPKFARARVLSGWSKAQHPPSSDQHKPSPLVRSAYTHAYTRVHTHTHAHTFSLSLFRKHFALTYQTGLCFTERVTSMNHRFVFCF